MNKQLKSSITALTLLLLVMATSGCVALLLGAAAGAGSVVYVKGDLEKNLDGSVERVHKAAVGALKSLDMFVTAEELATAESHINAQDAEGTKVSVHIVPLTEKVSKVKIRVGVLGDKAKSQIILDAIERKL